MKHEIVYDYESGKYGIFMSNAKVKRIKVTPIKSETLCRNCVVRHHLIHDDDMERSGLCDGCNRHLQTRQEDKFNILRTTACACHTIAFGEPCRYFYRSKS